MITVNSMLISGYTVKRIDAYIRRRVIWKVVSCGILCILGGFFIGCLVWHPVVERERERSWQVNREKARVEQVLSAMEHQEKRRGKINGKR